MNTAPITEPIPPICPKCNNPLKRIQIYPDLPLFYKCTNSICDQLVLDEDQDTPIKPEVVEPETAEIEAEVEVAVETAEESAEVTPVKCYVDVAKVDAEDEDRLVTAGKIQVVDNIEEADCILVKSKYSVSKNARNLGKEFDKELKPISDFE